MVYTMILKKLTLTFAILELWLYKVATPKHHVCLSTLGIPIPLETKLIKTHKINFISPTLEDYQHIVNVTTLALGSWPKQGHGKMWAKNATQKSHHILGSVKKCEGMSPHTPKGVSTDAFPSSLIYSNVNPRWTHRKNEELGYAPWLEVVRG
jgi:hypothetical protein